MSYSIDFDVATSEQIEQALCARLAEIRLSRDITQKDLAEKAQISPRTVRRMEKGEGVTLNSLVRVLMALELHHNLNALLPDPSIRPIDRVALAGKERKRATGRSSEDAPSDWSWGDDAGE